MFALASTILFIIAAVNVSGTDNPWFWAFLAFGALALHFAYEIVLPRRVAPPR